ncbi:MULTISPECIES: hypothetical protein [Pseudomonas]|uniref:Uncharacterized protein n=1 Tax=Pseudomonas reactans TaxID=117680 RepID=A0A7Y8FWY6_9PSED|nr:hypothetical protein [Pseudomonas reactans]NWD82534.1 hypothetical protein [Pseudomonas reactans]NWE87062.1 hypothetical protein [Pseudomonas reactans]
MAKSNNTQAASADKKKKSKGNEGSSTQCISPLEAPVPHGLAPPSPRAVDDLEITNALPPVDGLPANLMETIVAQVDGIEAEIPMWEDTLPLPGTNPDQCQPYLNGVPYGPPILRAKPLADQDWPIEVNFKGTDVANHGEYRLHYEIALGTGGNEQSSVKSANVDTIGPAGGVLLEAVTITAGAVGGKVTLGSLAANGDKLDLSVPGRLIPRPMDELWVYLNFTDTDPIKVVTGLPNNTSDVVVSLTKDEVVAKGSRLDYITFRYLDYSGNSTIPPKLREVEYLLTPQPTNLTDPEVPAAPLDLRDAQLKLAEVHLFGWTNYRPGQTVNIDLGGHVFPASISSEPTLTNPAKIEIPWLILFAAYGITAAGTANLRYQVVDGGTPSAWSNSISVAADLSSAAGEPGGPGPIRDSLPLITVTSSEGLTNEIGAGDDGDATAAMTVYAGAMPGHLLQVYWDGTPIFTPNPHTVTAAEIASGTFSFTITAAIIAAGLNGLDKPVWYSLTNGVNDNMDTSLSTLVDVFASELTNLALAQFPKSISAGGTLRSITCKQFVELGIDTRIKDAVNLKTGDTIRRFWTLYGEGLTSTNKLVEAEILPPIVVVNDHSLPGHNGEEFIADFATYVQPAILGRVEFYYTVLKADGVTRGTSLPTILLVSRRNADTTICGALPTP